MKYWLLKSEPDEFGIDDLERAPRRTTAWTGVRNFQARNYLRAMTKGDLAFFYHSSCEVPGVSGVMEVVQAAYPDPTQFDKASDYFDPKSKPAEPLWSAVDFKLVSKAHQLLPLTEMKDLASLEGMIVLRKGNRLSVTPVDPKHWKAIRKLIER